MSARIVLAGIVKDEAKGIIATLDAVLPAIDEVALLDTGSTDGTPEIIEEWMRKHNLPGLVVRGSWPNSYGIARNRSLNIARASGCGWILEIDADWILTGNVAELKQVLAADPKGDGFSIEVQTPVSTIHAVRLKRATAPWAWRGSIHEECIWTDPSSHPMIGRMHGITFYYRNTTEEKDRRVRYYKDIEMLLPDAEKGDGRAQFYLAQTHHCLGNQEEALQWYLKRGDNLTGPPGERAVALFRAGCLKPEPDTFISSFVADPSRSEPLWELAFLMGTRGFAARAKSIAQMAYKIPYPENSQFVKGSYYDMQRGLGTNNHEAIELRERQLRVLAGLE